MRGAGFVYIIPQHSTLFASEEETNAFFFYIPFVKSLYLVTTKAPTSLYVNLGKVKSSLTDNFKAAFFKIRHASNKT